MESNLATVNLSDFSRSLLTLLTFPGNNFVFGIFIGVSRSCSACVCSWLFEFHLVQSFVWGVYHAFSLLVLCHNLLSCEHRDSLPNANMHAQFNLE